MKQSYLALQLEMTRSLEGGLFTNLLAGRMGLGAKSPPQFGQRLLGNLVSTQSRQKVHSKLQIMASSADGGKSLSQHSQFGLNSSIHFSSVY
tara:strand:+ start:151 stop:426 length:276 start_codon:yes stop_codon:yes gene_type:complete